MMSRQSHDELENTHAICLGKERGWGERKGNHLNLSGCKKHIQIQSVFHHQQHCLSNHYIVWLIEGCEGLVCLPDHREHFLEKSAHAQLTRRPFSMTWREEFGLVRYDDVLISQTTGESCAT